MIQIYDLNAIQDQEIFLRRDEVRDVSAPVAGIIRTVREQGDRALYEYARRFDGVELSNLSVTGAELEAAMAQVEPEFLAVLREAADNIRAYHARQKRESFVMTQRDGVILGQRIMPLARVGIYVPGGTASYPSTVLMNAIPAQIAGVEDIVMVTPPGRDGAVSPAILAAAQVAGVTRIFKCGGAQAIAALAYGTESVPQVDKIVGPGNAYVAEAKKQVFGQVNIDMIAGPSEVLVLADGASNPAWVAADLLSQAEHDRMASAVLVTDSRVLAEQVARELEVQLSRLEREDIARESIERNGKIIVARFSGGGDPGGQPHRTGASGAVCRPAIRLSQPDPERRLHLFGAVRSGADGGLFRRAKSHPAHHGHRPVLQSPLGGRFHQKISVQLLHPCGSGAGLPEGGAVRPPGGTDGPRPGSGDPV